MELLEQENSEPVSGERSPAQSLGEKTAVKISSLIINGDDTLVLYSLDNEKIGVIRYRIFQERKICIIDFFGTKNGQQESDEYKDLLLLDFLDNTIKKRKNLSRIIMEHFLEDMKTFGIKSVYLQSDDASKKVFWKEKIGNFFQKQGIIQKVSSMGWEVQFQLSDR